MPAAYWIAHVHVTDAEAYGRYAAIATEAIKAHGGEFLARGGRYVQLEAAVACYHSELYQSGLAHAKGAAVRELVVVEAAG